MKVIRLVWLSLLSLCWVGCPTPQVCGPSTCSGCCDASGQCQTGLSFTACGAAGRSCDVCISSQACQAGACQAMSGVGGGAFGGGLAGGAGGGAAGGQGGGTEVLACGPNATLCGNACVNTQNSFSHCGACGQSCSFTQHCEGGVCRNLPSNCSTTPCPKDYFCDARTSRCEFGCQADPDCGGGQVCDRGRSLCVCPTGATLCGGLCVPENSPTACGFRCLSCTAAAGPNAVATCVNGACDFTCQPGFHRCGSRCVSNFDPATCGQRCDACPMPANATAICDGTSCGFTCAAGFHRCGSGCVSNFDVATCGNACTPCPTPANAVAVCRSATPGGPPACAFECNPGFVRCGNQCRPESATACGASCATCTPPAGATNPQCVSGQCQYTCAAGFHQCGTQCVPDTSVASCGTRCTACPTTSFGVATCDGTSCGIRCNTGYHECNGQCVWNFSVSTCGSRCTPCPAGPPGSGTTVTCDGTSCGLQCGSSVTPNFCNNACVANSVTTCGSTCQTCTAPANASPVCTSGVCGFTCNTGFHRCGAQCLPDDSPDSCGTSCSPCPPGPANTTPTCTRATTTSPYTCGWACGAGTNRCPANGDDCVPPDYSLGCGATCAVCSAGTSLERGVCGTNGICSVACINRCNNACVNVQTSAAHCGACGTGCASTDRCSMGECRAFCASGVGLGSLLPAVTVSSSSFPFVVVDVNGDGRNDLVAAEGTVLTVRLGNVNAQGTGPSGTFSPSPTSSTSLFYVPTQLVAGDLTGDGRPELVLLSTASVAEVLRNNGSGGFVRYTVSTSGVPTSATIGDFLGGGQPDLLLGFDTISTAASATLYPGVTTTTSSPVGSAVPANLGIGSVSGVRVATVTADALPDLVTAAAAKALFVFPGTGASNAPFNGAGGTSVQLPGNETFTGPGGGTFFPFEVADVTADGISDVVVPSVDGATTGVRVFPLTATPAFGASVFLATPASVRALALADVNGDGRRDVIVASSDVRVFLSQSGNAFSAAQVLGIAFSATFGNSLAAVDTTGDGRPELHTPSGSTLVTALNSGTGSFPAVQGAAAPTATRIAVGDLNGDGLSDVAVSSPRMGTGPIVGASTRLVNPSSNGSTVVGRVEVLNNGVWGTVCNDFSAWREGSVLCRSLGLGAVVDTQPTVGGTPGISGLYCWSSSYSTWQSCSYSTSTCFSGPAQLECTTTSALSWNSTTQVLFGAPNDTFTTGPSFDSRTDSMTIGDLNADGIGDLVVGSDVGGDGGLGADGGIAAVQVRLGSTAGTLGAPLVLPVVAPPVALVIAELSGDALADLVVGTPAGVQVFRGAGNGAFAAPATVSTLWVSSLAVADFNNDGKRDLVVATATSSELIPMMNVALGNSVGFVELASVFVSASSGASVLAVDVTYDGRADLVFGRQVWAGNGAGVFSLLTSSLPIQPPRQVLVDLDNDGALDLVAAGNASSVLSVARGSSSASFGFASVAQPFTSGAPVEDVAVARLNGDGARDLIVLQGTEGARRVTAVSGACR